jgi:protein SCO1/2
LAGLLLAGCTSTADEPAAVVITPSNTTGFAGTSLDEPLPKPDVTLTDTKGEDFNIAEDTKGRGDGAVHRLHALSGCVPDHDGRPECGDGRTAAGRRRSGRRRVHHDRPPIGTTPKAIGKWLSSFTWDQTTGLTGDFADIKSASDTVGIFIDPPVKNKDGTITVEHGAQVILFGKDDQSDPHFHVRLPAGGCGPRSATARRRARAITNRKEMTCAS